MAETAFTSTQEIIRKTDEDRATIEGLVNSWEKYTEGLRMSIMVSMLQLGVDLKSAQRYADTTVEEMRGLKAALRTASELCLNITSSVNDIETQVAEISGGHPRMEIN